MNEIVIASIIFPLLFILSWFAFMYLFITNDGMESLDKLLNRLFNNEG